MNVFPSVPINLDASASTSDTYQRGRLAAATALSTHTLVPGSAFAAAAKRIACAVVVFLFALALLGGTMKVVRQEKLTAAIGGGAFTLLFVSVGLWLVSSALTRYRDVVQLVEICHDGLRWKKGDKSASALWSDIADVDVACDVPQPVGGLVGAMQAWNATPKLNQVTVKLRSGDALVIRAGMLNDAIRFTQTVVERYKETLKTAQHAWRGDVFKAGPLRR
jgi:hypothetical protein